MKISTLIHHLTTISREHGNIDCFAYGIDDGVYGLSEPEVIHNVKIDSWTEGLDGDKIRTCINHYDNGEQTVVTL